ncbi:hypothetical protein D3C71_1634220 [compost metagenome]
MAIEEADGDFICQWDDDDWYHVNRLQYQFTALTAAGKSGSILTHWLIFNATNNKLYISHARNWEGSLLCSKHLFSLKQYDNSSRGEDTAVVEFLCEEGYIVNINEITGLYIYVYHGGNTWDLNHFNEIFACCQEIQVSPAMTGRIFGLSPDQSSVLIDEILLSSDIVI